jgi:hypothetical protein
MNYSVRMGMSPETTVDPLSQYRRLGRPDIYVRPTRLTSKQAQLADLDFIEDEAVDEPFTDNEMLETMDTGARNRIIRFAESLIHVAANLGRFKKTA